ncbi:MAG: hypothetical protein Tsb002_04480 [Wenzhouxiangellaceae bacterium]
MARLLQAAVLLLALLAGLMLSLWLTPPPENGGSLGQEPSLTLGQRRPAFRLGSITGAIHHMDDYDGHPVLINFWATWCEPCREEMPLLQQYSEQPPVADLAILGIALDDVAAVQRFAAELGINYPLLVGGPDVIAVSRDWGNARGVLPYSVLVGRDGAIRWRHFGPLDQSILSDALNHL